MASGLARRTELVEMAGGLYTLPEVVSLLNVSEEAVEDRHKAEMLIVVRSGGKYGYPTCQFTSGGIVEGLAAILEVMPIRADWMRLEWLLVPDDAFDGLYPLDASRKGESVTSLTLHEVIGPSDLIPLYPDPDPAAPVPWLLSSPIARG
jgi:hypothetical protein